MLGLVIMIPAVSSSISAATVSGAMTPRSLGRDRHGGVAAQGGARRIRAVRRVGDQDLRPLPPPVPMVGVDDQHPRQLPVGAGRRLQRHRVQARDLGQEPLQLEHQLQRPLGELGRQQRMGRGEPREAPPGVSLILGLYFIVQEPSG